MDFKEDLEEQEPDIEALLKDSQEDIKTLKDCDSDECERILVRLDDCFKQLEEQLNSYEANIQMVEPIRDQRPFTTKHTTYTAEYEDLKDKYDRFKNRASEDKVEEIIEVQEMTQEQAVKTIGKIGDAKQRDNLKTAKNILGMIHDSQDVVKSINKEIKEQNAKLLESEEIIKDSQSALARAKKLVDYFDTAFAKDCFLKVMLGLIALAIIGVIIFSCLSKGEATKAAQITQATTAITAGVDVVNCATADESPEAAASNNTGKVQCVELNTPLDPVASDSLKSGMEPVPEAAPIRMLRVVDSGTGVSK